MNFLTFIALLGLVISGLVTNSNAASTIPQNLSNLLTYEAATQNSTDFKLASRVNVYNVYWANLLICIPNIYDEHMCTLSYTDYSDQSGAPGLYLFDNNCNMIGHNQAVDRATIENSYTLFSELPWALVVTVAANPIANFVKGQGLHFLYAGREYLPLSDDANWLYSGYPPGAHTHNNLLAIYAPWYCADR